MALVDVSAEDYAEPRRTPAREPALPWARIRVAVLVPCYNEEQAIGKVIQDFRDVLPEATFYVFDNNSQDRTIEEACAAGAIVRREPLQGKGNVVRRMFADVDADVYVLVDGDDTYDASSAPRLIRLLLDGPLDMVNAARESEASQAYRPGHRFGNRMLTGVVATIFGKRIRDMLSGYRVFSRRFVKSFPALSAGFEIETELTIHALELRMPLLEIQTPFKERAEGSVSKLKTFRDGFRILKTILLLLIDAKPLAFFSGIAGVLLIAAFFLSVPVVLTYFETGLVPRLPTAVLVTGMMVLAALSFACGLVVHSVSRGRKELKRLQYLGIQPPPWLPLEGANR